MELKNKTVLITAGPTWVPIDNVRVISNTATGETGILLAERLQDIGAKVTLVLGPVELCCLNNRIRLIRFKFLAELKQKIFKELRSKKYDIVIQAAAVPDYAPAKPCVHKVNSGLKSWKLSLTATPKIIDQIKKIDLSLFVVGFKFEPKAPRGALIKRAKDLIKRANLDLAVANSIDRNKYRAYIINHSGIFGPMNSKKDMVERLVKLICKRL
jgi:phosphopantothenoylcysteine decarboxylase / phosphopantothenate---cysteine ligase